MYIDLTQKVVELCRQFGYENAKQFGDRYKEGYGNQAVRIADEGKTNFIGRCGEYAACLALGLNPETTLSWKNGVGDGGTDFMLKKWSVDIKTSDHPRARRLMWPVSKNGEIIKMADIIMLAVIRFFEDKSGEVELKGYTTRKDFKSGHKCANNEPGIVDGTLYMDSRDLKPVEDIVAWLQSDGGQ